MRLRITLLLLLAVVALLGFGLWSCAGDHGPAWQGYPSYPAGQVPQGDYVDGFTVVLTGDAGYAVMLLHESGEALLPMTVTDASGRFDRVNGAVMVGPEDDTFVVRFDSYGWPKHAIYRDRVIFYANWTDTTFDFMAISSDGTYEFARGVDRGAQSYLCPLAAPWIGTELAELGTSEEVSDPDPFTGYNLTSNVRGQLSSYGRSMQSYGYSVLPRVFYTGAGWRPALRWTGLGVEIAGTGVSAFLTEPIGPWVGGGEIVSGGFIALGNPYLSAVAMAPGTGVPMASAAVAGAAGVALGTGRTSALAAKFLWEHVTSAHETPILVLYNRYPYDFVW